MLFILLRVLEFNILINAPICKCASVTTSVTLLLDLTSSKALWKPAFSMLVLFFPTSLLSSVSIAMIFLLSFSIMEYVQYLAQWPGLSIRPSPFREKWNSLHTYIHTQFKSSIKKKKLLVYKQTTTTNLPRRTTSLSSSSARKLRRCSSHFSSIAGTR